MELPKANGGASHKDRLEKGLTPVGASHAAAAVLPVRVESTLSASKQRTTSSMQPPARRARQWITIYTNLWGLGILVVLVAAAWAMLQHLSELAPTTPAWWPPWEWPPWHLIALIVCTLPYIL